MRVDFRNHWSHKRCDTIAMQLSLTLNMCDGEDVDVPIRLICGWKTLPGIVGGIKRCRVDTNGFEGTFVDDFKGLVGRLGHRVNGT